MKRPPSFLKTVWRKLRGEAPKPPQKAPAQPAPVRKVISSLEPLEGRISPAVLLSSTVLMFKDMDGDIVTVKFSKPVFSLADSASNVNTANSVFKFTTGGVTVGPFDPAAAPAQQLQLLDLTKVPGATGNLQSVGISILAKQSGSGNGSVDVGYIKATGIGLGAVTIGGDLGQLDAGANSGSSGIASLTVGSLGVRGLSTQLSAGASLASNIIGPLGSLKVAGDFKEASIFSSKIGAVTIGGSLIGSAAIDSSSGYTGLISSTGDIGAVKIGAFGVGGIVGGGGNAAGQIFAGGKIASVNIAAGVTGGAGVGSGSIYVKGGIGSVTLGGNLTAGQGQDSGVISAGTTLGAVKIGGDIDAANNVGGGGGVQAGGNITSVSIIGALKGGGSTHSGFIDAGGNLGVTTLHDIIGGAGGNSGTITSAGKIASLKVLGNVTGGSTTGAGSVFSGFGGDIAKVTIFGKLTGGAGLNSGAISSGGKLGPVTIGSLATAADVVVAGGGGDFSGTVYSLGAITSVKITGSVDGGSGKFSGAIISQDRISEDSEVAGNIGAISISGHLKRGSGAGAGAISADGNVTSFTVGDVLAGGSIHVGGGNISAGNMGAVTVKGALTGSIIAEGRIGKVAIAGNASSARISAGDDIGALTFSKDVLDTVVSARGQAVASATADKAIGKISVLGNISGSRFLAGYDTALTASNADAQIGAVIVKGNWTTSDLVAGVSDGGAAGFGTVGDAPIALPNDSAIISQIASVVISGAVTGSSSGGDHFGFIAQKIGKFKADGVTFALNTLADGQFFELDPLHGDVTVREV